jgi:hypothetical protein
VDAAQALAEAKAQGIFNTKRVYNSMVKFLLK